ncbi:MAG: GIY-YIG nuclease family protein [bacterium]|nr:GIY-YIG nuclease family protein [bacterium]
MKEYVYYVYILTNKSNNRFYIGMTNDIYKRYLEHKTKINPNSFTSTYNINKLVYYEMYQYVQEAILREKELKGWRREKKINLITSENIKFLDLMEDGELT